EPAVPAASGPLTHAGQPSHHLTLANGDRLLVCGPQFNASASLCKHGFARHRPWAWGLATQDPTGDGGTLRLQDHAHLLCVEAAQVDTPAELAPGTTWQGSQTLALC
ncbi:hypothetical protein HA630_00680, partial [Aquabacterium sp. A08]|nr:hypothetical protein [Aquabacterium sp. A08]